MINNFDTSSTGTNIELDIFFNGEGARIAYQQNIRKVGKDLFLCSESNSPEKLYDLPKSAKQMFKDYCTHYFVDEDKNVGFGELRDLIDNLEHYVDIRPLKDCSPESMNEAILNLMGGTIELEEFHSSKYEPLFHKITSCGYSQGCQEEVIVTSEELKARGLPITEESARKLAQSIDNLLWDAPLHVGLTVNDTEYILSDKLKDVYY